MKNLSRLSLSVFIVLCLCTYASAQNNFGKTFGGDSPEFGFSVHEISSGGFIVAGNTSSFGAGNSDIYLVKTDAFGNEIWSSTFGDSTGDGGYSVQETADGSIIVVGETGFGTDNRDVYLVKTNASGTEVWSRTFGGSDFDAGYSVQETADGGFIIAGATSSFGAGDIDAFLIKTDASGNEVWSEPFGGSGDDYGYSVQETSDGGFIVAGTTTSFGVGMENVYLFKTDASGNVLWTKTFGGTGEDYGYSVQETSDGGFIVAGETKSSGSGSGDVYLVKTNASGNEVWSKTFGSDDLEDIGYSAQETSDGGFIVAGTLSQDSLDSEVYLIKTDSSGNEVWSETFGGSSMDKGRSVQETSDGGFIVAGHTDSFGAGDYDVYLVYFNPDNVFEDVPPGYWAEDFIYTIYNAGITSGCSQNPLNYCPGSSVTRAQMAVFLLRGIYGSSFTPQPATGIFDDCPLNFNPTPWIEEFFLDGITSGCSANPPLYCPNSAVTRAQMAVFLLRSKYGSDYKPPAATGVFDDVPVTNSTAPWVEQLAAEGITSGCSANPPLYCPNSAVTRAQMAVFITRTFGL